MSDNDTPAKGTIKIPRDDFEEHNERRKQFGQSWAEYINGAAPDVVEQLDRIESAATTTEERVAELERMLTEVTQR
jgi:hypothetical protein